MPEIAKSGVKITPYVGRQRINWDQVFDGRVWTFRKGVDYVSDDDAFKRKVIATANKRQVSIGFGEDPEGQVSVQALL